MFLRWGALIYRFRRVVSVLAVLLALASLSLASGAADELSAGGWLDDDSESAMVSLRLDEEFDAGRSSIIALYRSTTPGAMRSSPPT